MNDNCYPGTNVLVNKLNIRDLKELNDKEALYSFYRLAQLQTNPIQGKFDLKHLCDIHYYIFQDVYSFAGKIRNTDISKGNTLFALNEYIKPMCDKLFAELHKENYLKHLDIDSFSDRLAYYSAELNICHPFREGNGRSLREFIRCLSINAGYDINYSKISLSRLREAFISSVLDYSALKNLFKEHFVDNIKSFYTAEFPQIKDAPLSLLNKLQNIRQLLSDDNKYMSINSIVTLYSKIGKLIDGGSISAFDSTFKLVSDIYKEVNSILLRQKNEVSNSSEIHKSRTKNLDINEELT